MDQKDVPMTAAAHIVITGGGTGGHLFPGIAIARAFQRHRADTAILFVGTGRDLERRVVGQAGYRHAVIRVRGLKGMGVWRQLRALASLPGALLRAATILWGFRPAVVVGVGGYAAGPVCLAARLLGIPVCLQEQNSLPGITNRWLGRVARRIYTSFKESHAHFPADKVILVGNPVREEIIALGHGGAPRESHRPFTVLVAGGSQGARSINTALIDMLAHVDDPGSLHLIHQCGPDDLDRVREAYRTAGVAARAAAFFNDMDRQYAQADLAVCRAGATTVAELTCIGIPAIFIPFPHAADNHQEINARALVSAHAAEMILEAALSGRALWQHIRQLRDDPGRRAAMAQNARALGHPEAAATIVADIWAHVLQPTPALGRPENES
jgi:UDP-N-acetylglucosamine--N-acetylmuramyl-(pentapeptide) pyrophosphoryl-undecaprenol N-acetylglucosamine transferase